MHYVYTCRADIEFWRMPSRRFYVAKVSDFDVIRKSVKRKKLSLKRNTTSVSGRYVDLTNESDDHYQLGRIEEIVKKVCTKYVL